MSEQDKAGGDFLRDNAELPVALLYELRALILEAQKQIARSSCRGWLRP